MKMFTKMMSALMVVMLSSALLFGQTVIFEDNFDAYTAGGQLACQNPTDWTTWTNAPCGSEDAYISSLYAHSSPNSTVIAQNNDLVKDFGDPYTTGKYSISFYAYIPATKAGYFNTLQTFSGAQVWGIEVYLNAGGAGSINAGGTGTATFVWTPDVWFLVEQIVDLDYDHCEFWIDGNMIYDYQWSLGATGTGQNTLEANDFFGATANDQMYIDDYKLEEMEGLNLNPPTNLTATVTNNDVYLDWDAPSGGGGQLYELIQHDGNNVNGYFQAFNSGYGVVYDLSGYTDVTLEMLDFRHSSWGLTGTWNYKLHIVDWDTHTEISVVGPLQTTGNDHWEVEIPLGSVPETGLVGVFLEPMGNVATDAYPDLDSDDVGPDGMSYFGPLSNYSGMGLSAIGDFLMDLWIMASTEDGLVKAVKYAPNYGNEASRLPGPDPAVDYLTLKQTAKSAKAQLMGYDVYRDGAMIDYVAAPVTDYDDMDLSSGTYEYYVKAVYDEGDSPASNSATAVIENPVPPAPQNLVATGVTNGVQLTWDAVGSGEWIQWDAGVNNGNGVGLTNGGTFSVASRWMPADLTLYNGFSLQKVQFFPNADPAAYLCYQSLEWNHRNNPASSAERYQF